MLGSASEAVVVQDTWLRARLDEHAGVTRPASRLADVRML